MTHLQPRDAQGRFGEVARDEASDVVLMSPEVADFASRFRREVDDVTHRWRASVAAHDDAPIALFSEVHDLGEKIAAASEPDRPRLDDLNTALDDLADEQFDIDRAHTVVDVMKAITAPGNMYVAEDGKGGHVRLTDGKPAHTCPGCGNGYATVRVLEAHTDECEAVGLDEDIADAVNDDLAHDRLHSAAESFASSVNNAGRADQIGFLRRMGVSDDEILREIEASDPTYIDGALDDLVVERASQTASQAYNDGVEDPEEVTRALEGKRWLTTANRPVVKGSPTALKRNECTEVTYRDTDGTEVTYRVGYSEWTPNGDNGDLAIDYRRGEFFAESEWAAAPTPAAEQSSPFRPSRGETAQMVGYAWEQFEARLKVQAREAARAKRTDPLRSFLDRESR